MVFVLQRMVCFVCYCSRVRSLHISTNNHTHDRWDEDVFGLEYDLDLFNIVAVDDFNMGAMENKRY